MPVSIFSVVDLPAPLGPMKATRSPRAIAKERSRTAVTCAVGAGRSLAPRRRHPVARADRTRKLLLSPSTVIAGMIHILSFGDACRGARRLQKQKRPRRLRRGPWVILRMMLLTHL